MEAGRSLLGATGRIVRNSGRSLEVARKWHSEPYKRTPFVSCRSGFSVQRVSDASQIEKGRGQIEVQEILF
jgi:hypothetical protein